MTSAKLCLTTGIHRVGGTWTYPSLSGSARYIMRTALLGRQDSYHTGPLDMGERSDRYNLALGLFGLYEDPRRVRSRSVYV